MNTFEKELAQLGLDKEKVVKKSLEELYQNALDEINERVLMLMSDSLTQSKIYRIEYQKALKGHVSAILDNLKNSRYDSISEYLKGCYEDGFLGTLYNLNKSGIPMFLPMMQEQIVDAVILDSKISEGLYTRLGNDTKVLKKRISSEISRGLSTSMSYADIARNLENQSRMSINNAMNIVQTEGHRIQIRSALDSGNKARAKGADLVKVWDSTLDSKTRDHHRELDGQVRELDEDFEVDGITVSAPGQFGMPSEDCRCRCALLIKPRWDVAGSFTKRDNETGELLEFKNASDYQEFKQKYWNMVDKSGESGIINTGAISGALNPYSKEAEKHAAQYYESVRHMKTDIKHIAANTGISENDIYKIKEHIFLKKHDLGGSEPEYFYPSYEMAQSWQRLIDGKNIKEHDITLLRHELMEYDLMEQGYSQFEAHRITENKYNYGKEVKDYYAEINKHSKK